MTEASMLTNRLIGEPGNPVILTRFIFRLCLSVLALPGIIQGQGQPSLDARISVAVAKMANQELAAREAGFDELLSILTDRQTAATDGYSGALESFFRQHPEQASRVKLALIDLLKADNSAFIVPYSAQSSFTDDDSEHYAEVIAVVSSLNDERTIPALAGAISTGWMARNGILKYGASALAAVLAQLRNPLPEVRASAFSVSIAILKMKNDPASRAQALDLIRSGLSDAEYMIRSAALDEVEQLKDKSQFVPALKEMAERDAFIVPGQTEYRLRVRARKLLGQ
jgi:hypothetical protein